MFPGPRGGIEPGTETRIGTGSTTVMVTEMETEIETCTTNLTSSNNIATNTTTNTNKNNSSAFSSMSVSTNCIDSLLSVESSGRSFRPGPSSTCSAPAGNSSAGMVPPQRSQELKLWVSNARRQPLVRLGSFDNSSVNSKVSAGVNNVGNISGGIQRKNFIGRCRQPINGDDDDDVSDAVGLAFNQSYPSMPLRGRQTPERPWYDISDDDTSTYTSPYGIVGYDSESSFYT
ncbi:hypothetical protein Ahia01_001000400 [Argonauta hians]